MKCPTDGATLLISDKQNIEIDYCPECRGVWLDRGELDKIIERSAPQDYRSAPPAPRPEAFDEPNYRYDAPKHHPKKRESFLGDLFDF